MNAPTTTSETTTEPKPQTPITDKFEVFCLGTGTPELVKKTDAISLELELQSFKETVQIQRDHITEVKRQRDDYKSAHDALAELNKDLCAERDKLKRQRRKEAEK